MTLRKRNGRPKGALSLVELYSHNTSSIKGASTDTQSLEMWPICWPGTKLSPLSGLVSVRAKIWMPFGSTKTKFS